MQSKCSQRMERTHSGTLILFPLPQSSKAGGEGKLPTENCYEALHFNQDGRSGVDKQGCVYVQLSTFDTPLHHCIPLHYFLFLGLIHPKLRSFLVQNILPCNSLPCPFPKVPPTHHHPIYNCSPPPLTIFQANGFPSQLSIPTNISVGKVLPTDQYT